MTLLLLQLTALTEEALKHRLIITMDQLSWSEKKNKQKKKNHNHQSWLSLDCHTGGWRHSDGIDTTYLSAGIRFVMTPLDLTVPQFQCPPYWKGLQGLRSKWDWMCFASMFEDFLSLLCWLCLKESHRKSYNIHKKIKCIKETHDK